MIPVRAHSRGEGSILLPWHWQHGLSPNSPTHHHQFPRVHAVTCPAKLVWPSLTLMLASGLHLVERTRPSSHIPGPGATRSGSFAGFLLPKSQMSNGTLFPICWGELPTETGHPQKRLLSPFLEGSLGSWESDGITFGQEPPYEGVSPVKDHILWLGPQGMKMVRMRSLGLVPMLFLHWASGVCCICAWCTSGVDGCGNACTSIIRGSTGHFAWPVPS